MYNPETPAFPDRKYPLHGVLEVLDSIAKSRPHRAHEDSWGHFGYVQCPPIQS